MDNDVAGSITDLVDGIIDALVDMDGVVGAGEGAVYDDMDALDGAKDTLEDAVEDD